MTFLLCAVFPNRNLSAGGDNMILRKAGHFRISILKQISREILFVDIPRSDVLKYSFKKPCETVNGKIQGYINDQKYAEIIHSYSQEILKKS